MVLLSSVGEGCCPGMGLVRATYDVGAGDVLWRYMLPGVRVRREEGPRYHRLGVEALV